MRMKTFRLSVFFAAFAVLLLVGCRRMMTNNYVPMTDEISDLIAESAEKTAASTSPEIRIFFDNTASMRYFATSTDNWNKGARGFMNALDNILPAGNYRTYTLQEGNTCLEWMEMNANLFDEWVKPDFYISTDGNGSNKPLPKNGSLVVGPLKMLLASEYLTKDTINIVVTDLLDQNCKAADLSAAIYEEYILNDDSDYAVLLIGMKSPLHGYISIPNPNVENEDMLIKVDSENWPWYWIISGPRASMCNFSTKLLQEFVECGLREEEDFHFFYLHGKDLRGVKYENVVTSDIWGELDIDKNNKKTILENGDFYCNKRLERIEIDTIFGDTVTGYSKVFAYQYVEPEQGSNDDKNVVLNLYLPLFECTEDNYKNYGVFLDSSVTKEGATLGSMTEENNILLLPTHFTEESTWLPVNYYDIDKAGFAITTEIIAADTYPAFVLESVVESEEDAVEVTENGVFLDSSIAEYWYRIKISYRYAKNESESKAIIFNLPVWAVLKSDIPDWVNAWNASSVDEYNLKDASQNRPSTYGLRDFCRKMSDSEMSIAEYQTENRQQLANIVVIIDGLPS